MKISALEAAPAQQGGTAAEALAAAEVLVDRLDGLGYERVWFAEHHASEWASSVVPAVLIAHFAGRTSRIRVGSGGVMLPNHAPRAVAEQFATLGVLHPGRIDLGVGRGPGAHDPEVVRQLRRGAGPATDYRADVTELLRLLTGQERLITGALEPVDAAPWLLSSSPSGAELAGALGLPLAFAHHIRPDSTAAAAERYRASFVPSRWSAEPYLMVAVETIVAGSDEEAARLAVPADAAKSGLFAGTGETALLPPSRAGSFIVPEDVRDRVASHTAAQVRGSVGTAARQFARLVELTGADELMLLGSVYDPADRVRTFELASKAVGVS